MLRMSRLTKTYRTDHVETRTLQDFSLEVRAGEFVAITGPSGSYVLDGRDVSRLTDDDRSLLRNAKIGFIFQSFNLLPDLSSYDNIDEHRAAIARRPMPATPPSRSELAQ